MLASASLFLTRPGSPSLKYHRGCLRTPFRPELFSQPFMRSLTALPSPSMTLRTQCLCVQTDRRMSPLNVRSFTLSAQILTRTVPVTPTTTTKGSTPGHHCNSSFLLYDHFPGPCAGICAGASATAPCASTDRRSSSASRCCGKMPTGCAALPATVRCSVAAAARLCHLPCGAALGGCLGACLFRLPRH